MARLTLKKNHLKWYPRPELNRDKQFRKLRLYPFELRGRWLLNRFYNENIPLAPRCHS